MKRLETWWNVGHWEFTDEDIKFDVPKCATSECADSTQRQRSATAPTISQPMIDLFEAMLSRNLSSARGKVYCYAAINTQKGGTEEGRWDETAFGVEQWQVVEAVVPTSQCFVRHAARRRNAPVSRQTRSYLTSSHLASLPSYLLNISALLSVEIYERCSHGSSLYPTVVNYSRESPYTSTLWIGVEVANSSVGPASNDRRKLQAKI